jgi:hypothetical protein
LRYGVIHSAWPQSVTLVLMIAVLVTVILETREKARQRGYNKGGEITNYKILFGRHRQITTFKNPSSEFCSYIVKARTKKERNLNPMNGIHATVNGD